MKKSFKRKSFSGWPRVEPDMAGLINNMQQQLVIIEKKIDTLISNLSPRQVGVETSPRPFEQHGRTHSHGGGRQDNRFRERILYKAICADCKKECEVPFRPSEDRPVYCKECFSKRRAESSHKGRFDNRPREAGHAQAVHFDKPRGGEKKMYAGKRRPPFRRRKARA